MPLPRNPADWNISKTRPGQAEPKARRHAPGRYLRVGPHPRLHVRWTPATDRRVPEAGSRRRGRTRPGTVLRPIEIFGEGAPTYEAGPRVSPNTETTIEHSGATKFERIEGAVVHELVRFATVAIVCSVGPCLATRMRRIAEERHGRAEPLAEPGESTLAAEVAGRAARSREAFARNRRQVRAMAEGRPPETSFRLGFAPDRVLQRYAAELRATREAAEATRVEEPATVCRVELARAVEQLRRRSRAYPLRPMPRSSPAGEKRRRPNSPRGPRARRAPDIVLRPESDAQRCEVAPVEPTDIRSPSPSGSFSNAASNPEETRSAVETIEPVLASAQYSNPGSERPSQIPNRSAVATSAPMGFAPVGQIASRCSGRRVGPGGATARGARRRVPAAPESRSRVSRGRTRVLGARSGRLGARDRRRLRVRVYPSVVPGPAALGSPRGSTGAREEGRTSRGSCAEGQTERGSRSRDARMTISTVGSRWTAWSV